MKTPDSIHCRPGTTEAMERLAAENEALRAERDVLSTAKTQLKITLSQLQQAIGHTERDNEALEAERDRALAQIIRFKDASEQVSMAAEYADAATSVHMAPSVHWLLKVADETPAQSVAHIKAAGAREALQRAMKTPGFSNTVVRVDALQAVIEQMEGKS